MCVCVYVYMYMYIYNYVQRQEHICGRALYKSVIIIIIIIIRADQMICGGAMGVEKNIIQQKVMKK